MCTTECVCAYAYTTSNTQTYHRILMRFTLELEHQIGLQIINLVEELSNVRVSAVASNTLPGCLAISARKNYSEEVNSLKPKQASCLAKHEACFVFISRSAATEVLVLLLRLDP